jgi:hypothetical protein
LTMAQPLWKSAPDRSVSASAGATSRASIHIARINPYRWMESASFLGHYAEMPDLMRWRYIRRIFELNQPPPQDTFWRCRKHANFAITPAALDIRRMQGDEIVSVRRWAICASTF